MEQGFWINYSTNKVFRIDDHERWIRRWPNAKKLGIKETTYKQYIDDFVPEEDRMKLLLWVMNQVPVIRVRGHGATVTFEFSTEKVRSALDAIYDWGLDYAGDYSSLHIVNFKKTKKVDILFKNFKKLYEEGREDTIMEENSKQFKILKTFKQYMEDKNVNSKINESSLSRLWSHNIKHDCGAITAFRKGRDCGEGTPYTKKEKKARNKSLLSKLIGKGYDVTSLKGKYPEGGEIVDEHSFFVVDQTDKGNLLKELQSFGKLFEQDSILFVPKNSISGESKAFLISTNKCPNAYPGFGKLGVKETFNKGTLGKDSPIYTSYVKGRPFIFEEIDKHIHTPGNGFGWWSLYNLAEKDWTELIEK